MADSTLSALPKRDLDAFSRSLDSIKSIYDSPSLAERIRIPQRPPSTHLTPTQTRRTCHSATQLHSQVPYYGEFWNRTKMML